MLFFVSSMRPARPAESLTLGNPPQLPQLIKAATGGFHARDALPATFSQAPLKTSLRSSYGISLGLADPRRRGEPLQRLDPSVLKMVGGAAADCYIYIESL